MHPLSTPWDLAGLLGVLRRRRRWIVASAVLAPLLALALSLLATPLYEADVEVLVEPDVPTTTDPAAVGRVMFLEQELQTQLRLLQSEAIASRVVQALELDVAADAVLDSVDAIVLPTTRVIRLTATDPDPDRAAQLAQAVAEEYLAFRRADALERLEEAAGALEARLARAEAELARVDEELEQTGDPGLTSTLLAERNALSEAIVRLDAQLSHLETSDPVARGGGRVIRQASVPATPSEPRPLRNVVVALVLGLGVGIVLALAADSLDDSVQTAGDAEAVAGRPVIGRIPTLGQTEGGVLPMLRQADGVPAEAFRDLRTNLRFVGGEDFPRVVVLTGSARGEGTSVIAANLAAAAGLAGRSVILVDANLRRPAQGGLFDHPGSPGLSGVLAGVEELDDVLFTVPGLGLDIVFAGERPPSPSELIGSQAMVEVIAALAEQYEIVVIDTPAALAVPDVLEFVACAEATLLVVDLERSSRREVREATERLTRAHARVSGLVVNRDDLEGSGYDHARTTGRARLRRR